MLGDDGATCFQRIDKVNIVYEAGRNTPSDIYDHMGKHITFDDDPYSQVGWHMIIGVAHGG